jgi:hypothetical protein
VATSAVPSQTPATPAKAKNASKSKRKESREFGDVGVWKESRTAARADSRIKPGDAYKAYCAWCTEKGLEPVTLTAFGTTMKGELGVVYEEKNKRGFYVGIAMVTAPRLATDNTKVGAMAPLRMGYGLRPVATIPG